MASAAGQLSPAWLLRVTPQAVLLALLATAAAAWIVREADGRWDMAGTMGYGFLPFIAMWATMMVAMMLPSVAPFATMYARSVQHRRLPRLLLFAGGYLLVWGLMGVPVYGAASLADEYAGGTAGTLFAAAMFAGCGLYQLTPLKERCLAHCRTPMGHLLHFASFRGPVRDLRAGFEHGFFCAACCWALMVLLVAFGIMNVPAMVLLAAVVALEKIWRRGPHLARGVGAAALVAAVAVFWVPGLAPGLTNEPMDMSPAAMDGSMSMDDDAGTAGNDAMDSNMDGMGDE
jgi:predicted metal-binding membrane protein